MDLKAKLKSQIPEILQKFNAKTFKSGDLRIGICPVHNGDNSTAFNINCNKTSEYCGRWFCNTQGCHKKFGGDILGLMDGLCNAIGPTPFREVLEISHSLAGTEKVDYVSDFFNDLVIRNEPILSGPSREEVRNSLIRPAQFYLDRGYSESVLDEFDVGVCLNEYDPMFNRVVFPVYDNTGKFLVGGVGRTLVGAPDKWKNKFGFKKSEHLYGYWKAIQPICQTSKVILVEGQGDVLRFWQAGIKNVLGIFGSNLSDYQENMLQKTGVSSIITVFDRDTAGEKCREDCKRLSRLFNLKQLLPEGADVGEMSISQIQNMKELV